MANVAVMGELLLRLTPPNYEMIRGTKEFLACYGGSEANVGISLAQLGHKISMLSKVPDNSLGIAVIEYLQRFGINCDYIVKGGERLGTYYLEQGAYARSSKVIYDRKYSSMAECAVADFDFQTFFADKQWFHVSGITPAISNNAAIVTEVAIKEAKRKGLSVSFDMNYRSKLWTYDEARKVLKRLLPHVDVLFGGALDFQFIFDTKNTNEKELYHRAKDEFQLQSIISTYRECLSSSEHTYRASYYDGNQWIESPKCQFGIVDRVGAGDAFAGGYLAKILDGASPEEALKFGVAASVLKHSIPGDANIINKDDIEQLANQTIKGNVER